MRIFIPKETHPGETRTALTPENATKLAKLGIEVEIESGAGSSIGHPDQTYESAGATISTDPSQSAASADVILRVRKPVNLDTLRPGVVHVSYLDPFNEKDLVRALAAGGVSAVSMEMIPRSTLAQKMDALSSQANLAGYVAVILAAEKIDRIFPMMMTPSGTLSPARVFVIGAGVAGLQAIATAKRLGARVEAFDTRPVVEEQVQSLGAKFVKVDLGDTGQTAQGYAKQLTPEQLEIQRQAMARHCAQADVVITTAQLFGRPAPRIITRSMVEAMRPGSIIVDMAVETGGNVEGSELDLETNINGVRILGMGNLPGRVALHASQMYSNNLYNFLEHFWDKESKSLKLDLSDEILKSCLVTHKGEIVNETIRTLLNPA